MSNTLILIVTVYYGAITGEERHEFYGGYTAAAAAAMRRRADSYNPVPVFTYGENARQRNSKNNRNMLKLRTLMKKSRW
ncbi:hypothetical protein F2Q70_00030490 [Brassica cretica]|uniref:Uncharacterized protein n=1 Tax=Brassica cretica TaxID=69181 RepID=A0A8S9FKW9_BRACR|nr:hypothetical protein F2Q70_00030490 [Brassica cretica]